MILMPQSAMFECKFQIAQSFNWRYIHNFGFTSWLDDESTSACNGMKIDGYVHVVVSNPAKKNNCNLSGNDHPGPRTFRKSYSPSRVQDYVALLVLAVVSLLVITVSF